MPTPSSDQLPSPPSEGFSTCPDDLQHSLRPGWQVEGQAIDSHQNPDTQITDAPALVTTDTNDYNESREDILILEEERASGELLSRDTTMSPTVRSDTTASTTSPTFFDGEMKRVGIKECLGRAVTSPSQQSCRSGHDRSASLEVEDAPESQVDEDDGLYSPSMGSDYSSLRSKPISPSSYLRAGSRFHGTQQSERQVYDVQVEIKHVDMRESFLCGYLRIQGLTEDHPTLTTYFEGEIIGSKYNFFTQHEDWGANHKVDLSHWSKFEPFKQYQKHARRGPVAIDNVSQCENIFMRWKEHFLVPDHRVRTITGASFEGFYYICFNQLEGKVTGIYFHSKSEKFQQLELKHMPNRGCFSATEFR